MTPTRIALAAALLLGGAATVAVARPHGGHEGPFGWDRFVLPWPFSRIAIAVGEPVLVDRSTVLSDEAQAARLQQHMERTLHEQYRRARAALRSRAGPA